MKGRILNAVENDRARLIQQGEQINGKDCLKEFNKVADDPFAPPCKALQGQPQVGP